MIQDLKEARKICLRLAHKAQDGNLQSAFSSIDMLWALENKIMNKDDIIILSKGQSTLALYAVLIQNGTYWEEEFDNIGKYGGKYSIQVDITKGIKGVYNSAGALGHGLPFACGIAMAKKVKGESGRVFVLVGDGELNEGTMWESCLIAERFRLDNLWIIVDNNSSHDIPFLEEKLASFSALTWELSDGNNTNYINDTMNNICISNEKFFKAIIVDTRRGYGCPSMMNGPKWFHRAPNDAELTQLSKEIDEQ
jgi:transketolase